MLIWVYLIQTKYIRTNERSFTALELYAKVLISLSNPLGFASALKIAFQ